MSCVDSWLWFTTLSRAVLSAKWSGPRIGFGFTNCPICKVRVMRVMMWQWKNTRILKLMINMKVAMTLAAPRSACSTPPWRTSWTPSCPSTPT